jgi:hypothetical protein
MVAARSLLVLVGEARMTFEELIGPAVVAAIVSGAVSIFGSIFSNRSLRKINGEKIASEERSAERKFEFEKELSERKFFYERSLHDYRRRVEFAEELLTSFYKLKDTIRAIRSPMSYESEAKDRIRDASEGRDLARSRDSYYVANARIQKNSEFLSDIISKKYRAQAVFQGDTHRAFELVVSVINTIQIASSMLVDQAGKTRQDVEFWRKLEREIWDAAPPNKPDELTIKILQAIEIIETAVRPTLEQGEQRKSAQADPPPALSTCSSSGKLPASTMGAT